MGLWVSFTATFLPQSDGGRRNRHRPGRPIIGQMLATGQYTFANRAPRQAPAPPIVAAHENDWPLRPSIQGRSHVSGLGPAANWEVWPVCSRPAAPTRG